MFPGYRGDTYFLPDSFGYNGNLPQILNGCGVTYFVTSKLSWNDTNRFPYDTFLWKGIDGTVIKAHMIPGGYNGRNTPTEIISLWGNVRTKENQTSLCHTVGEGDGGGGTRREDIELLRRSGRPAGMPERCMVDALRRTEGCVRQIAEPAGLPRGAVLRAPPGNIHLTGQDETRIPENHHPSAQRRIPSCRSVGTSYPLPEGNGIVPYDSPRPMERDGHQPVS
jgi:hypothetical protein